MESFEEKYKKCDLSISGIVQVGETEIWSFNCCITIHAEDVHDNLFHPEVEANSLEEAKASALNWANKKTDELLEGFIELDK